MLVIGLTGTLGSGKGTVVDFLVGRKGFIHFSVRHFLLDVIRNSGLPENRDSMVIVANSLRKEHGSSYIVDCLYAKAATTGKNCVIESIRTPGEICSLRSETGFYLISVDADPAIRYERILKRGSETDNISYQTFLDNELREMSAVDPDKQNLKKCISMADFSIENNGSVEDLFRKTENILKKIKYSING